MKPDIGTSNDVGSANDLRPGDVFWTYGCDPRTKHDSHKIMLCVSTIKKVVNIPQYVDNQGFIDIYVEGIEVAYVQHGMLKTASFTADATIFFPCRCHDLTT